MRRSGMRWSVLWLVFVLGCCLGAPLLATHDPMHTSSAALLPPENNHWLGTDLLGRDIFSRLLYGGQRTLLVAVGATMLAVVPGLLLALLAGQAGYLAGKLFSTVLNALLPLPAVVLALVILTLLGRGDVPLAIATGAGFAAFSAQILRASVVQTYAMAHIEGARAVGAHPVRILRQHIFPQLRPTLLAVILTVFGYVLLNSATLSFLGFGAPPGVPEWGVMVQEGRGVFKAAPMVSILPGVLLLSIVLALNTLAFGLREPK